MSAAKLLFSTVKCWLSWRCPFLPRPPQNEQQAGKDAK